MRPFFKGCAAKEEFLEDDRRDFVNSIHNDECASGFGYPIMQGNVQFK